MKSTTVAERRKDDFLKYAHIRPERKYTGNKPDLGVCRGTGEGQADTRKKSSLAAFTL